MSTTLNSLDSIIQHLSNHEAHKYAIRELENHNDLVWYGPSECRVLKADLSEFALLVQGPTHAALTRRSCPFEKLKEQAEMLAAQGLHVVTKGSFKFPAADWVQIVRPLVAPKPVVVRAFSSPLIPLLRMLNLSMLERMQLFAFSVH